MMNKYELIKNIDKFKDLFFKMLEKDPAVKPFVNCGVDKDDPNVYFFKCDTTYGDFWMFISMISDGYTIKLNFNGWGKSFFTMFDDGHTSSNMEILKGGIWQYGFADAVKDILVDFMRGEESK